LETQSDTIEDGPLGGLTLQDTHLLKNPNIDVVALEVRWGKPTRSLTAAEAVAVRDAIEKRVEGLRLPVVEGMTQRMVTVQFDGQKADTSTTDTEGAGHQLRAENQAVSFALLPHAVAIQIGSGYERWSVSARPLIESVLAAVIPLVSPELVARIGLRYVNRIEDESCVEPSDWAGKIAPPLLAPYREWELGSRVRSANQAIELTVDEDHGAALRHGVVYQRTGLASDYLLDIDVFSQRVRTPDTEALVRAFTRMNRTALAIFQKSVVEDYLIAKYEEVATE